MSCINGASPRDSLNGNRLTSDAQRDAWVVKGHGDAIAVLRDSTMFASGPRWDQRSKALAWQARLLMKYSQATDPFPFSDDKRHWRIRSVVGHVLSRSRAEEASRVTESIANQLVDRFISLGRVELVRAFVMPLPLHVMCTLLGFQTKHHLWLAGLRDSWLRLYRSPQLRTWSQLAHARDAIRLSRFIDRHVRRTDHAPNGIVAGLKTVPAADGQALTIAEVSTAIVDLLVAGHLTISRAIGSAVIAITAGRTAERWGAIDPMHLDALIEETLRCSSPTQVVQRTALGSVQMGDVDLEPGATILVDIGAANRDPSVFAEPDVFDPSRPSNKQQLTFGRGMHSCLGSMIARAEVRAGLTVLNERLPNLCISGPAKRETLPFSCGWAEIPVQWADDAQTSTQTAYESGFLRRREGRPV
jgi:cytochrome P450